MTVEEWLGTDNKLGIDIWHKKYQYNNETFDEWVDRISGGDTSVGNLIREKKFLFGGRILANRGLENKDKKVSLSNCYCIDPPTDSIESIFDCAKKLARTYSYGGGCGVDLSNLCPKGAKVRNAAEESTGTVSFMDLYSMVTEVISQRGRRGALMLSLSCEHPDLEDFIELKSDLNKVTKANTSIRITDKFMTAVRNKQPFTLSFTRKETGETITKTVDAAKVFHRICEMNWDYAEPGMLFWDRIENWNLLSCDDNFKYAGTNPCFGGKMELLTVDGYKTFEELDGTEPYIYNVNGDIVKSKVWCSGEKDTIILKIYNGENTSEVICTPDHRFMLSNGTECFAKDLLYKEIKTYGSSNNADVIDIKLGEKIKVYDFTEPETHWGVVNGYVVHNCARHFGSV